MTRSRLAAALMAVIHSKSLRQNGITGKSQETRPSRQPTRPRRRRVLLLPAQEFQAHCHALRQTRTKLFSTICLVAAVVNWRWTHWVRTPTNLGVSDFHSVRKVTRSLGLQKDIFAPLLCPFGNGRYQPAAGGLASVLDVPGGCISVPGWRCRRTCRRLPLRNAGNW
jgi:hypothetical protein